MVLGPEALPLLEQWQADLQPGAVPLIQGWRPDGPGRDLADAGPLIDWLKWHALVGSPFTFNALRQERQGGRRYPFFIPGYEGRLPISRRKYEAAGKAGPRHLLSAIRRDVRGLLQVPPGWTLLEVDFKSCHPAIGVALSGCEALARDVELGIHQRTGDWIWSFAPWRPPAENRRQLGKRINNMALFGATPHGIRRELTDHLGVDPGHAAAAEVWEAWWHRYPGLLAFAQGVLQLVQQAQAERLALEIVAPSGRRSRFSKAEVLGRVAKGSRRAAPGPDGVWRTVFSACFRAVEGDLLDRTLTHFHEGQEEHGGRPILPLYDGLLAAAPTGREQEVWEALKAAAARAAAEVGVARTRLERKAP